MSEREARPRSSSQAQEQAEAVRDSMFANDAASQALGMRVDAIGPGYARLIMTVRPDMLNGFSICHGGPDHDPRGFRVRFRLQ